MPITRSTPYGPDLTLYGDWSDLQDCHRPSMIWLQARGDHGRLEFAAADSCPDGIWIAEQGQLFDEAIITLVL